MPITKKQISNFPLTPGIYFFENFKKEIIYIGKAVNLRKRLQSYLKASNLGSWTKKMLFEARSVSYKTTPSEFEALLLEPKLINQYQPKYNIQFKDDKSFNMIAISKEDFPRVYLSRKKDKKAWYFGPFPSGSEVKKILKFLRVVFPFRTCKKILKKPCLYYQLKLCPGCPIKAQKLQYQKTITRLKRLLNGQVKNLLKNLEKEMRKQSQLKKYEKAEIIKNQIQNIKYIVLNWQSLDQKSLSLNLSQDQKMEILNKARLVIPKLFKLKRIEAYDISNLQGKQATASMVVFEDLIPEKSQYRRFRIKLKAKPDDPAMMKEVLKRRLKHPEWVYPNLILVDGGKTQVSSAFKALKEADLEKKIFLLGLVKEEEIIIKPVTKNSRILSFKRISPSQKDLFLKLLIRLRNEAHRFAKKYHLLLRKKRLKLL
ncbi:hypothetical protein COT75_01020 [Candidatus Beckwithbacteria bacterium CG10_big_fil_rev_8_21_14_0_10_34_10]|uniref:Excinuclease ABC subunit C n=1 Tax=Candidatus Beckwithbacteria bacterium CG10_big_fil_rev_8_21_14_0_10_34_10 TaxID=1974495 RepID=A0A2H0WA85_9BACT|nr:MAG: hypothetical protein COT75_01020 [Candidatus Beckwithbacteria bacterium CG10_big_fil_rev_8_21_14_0_10_34_10]